MIFWSRLEPWWLSLLPTLYICRSHSGSESVAIYKYILYIVCKNVDSEELVDGPSHCLNQNQTSCCFFHQITSTTCLNTEPQPLLHLATGKPQDFGWVQTQTHYRYILRRQRRKERKRNYRKKSEKKSGWIALTCDLIIPYFWMVTNMLRLVDHYFRSKSISLTHFGNITIGRSMNTPRLWQHTFPDSHFQINVNK